MNRLLVPVTLVFVVGAFGSLVASGCDGPGSAGEGEGEGAAEREGEGGGGEGEGEGAGDCTSLADFADPAAVQFVLTAGSFQADAANIAQCSGGESPFTVTFTFATTNGSGYEPFFDATNVAVADNGTPAHDGIFAAGGACDATPTGVDDNSFECDGIQICNVTCPLCYTTAPTDLAVQFTEPGATRRTQAQCVLP